MSITRSPDFNPAIPGAIGGTTSAAITGTIITANTKFVAAVGSQAAPSIGFADLVGWYQTNTGSMWLTDRGSTTKFGIYGSAVMNASANVLAFSSDASLTTSSPLSVSLSYVSSGVLGVGTGAAGSVAGGLSATTYLGTVGSVGAPTFKFADGVGFYQTTTGTMWLSDRASNAKFGWTGAVGAMGSNSALAWSNTANDATATLDTFLFRSSAGVLNISTSGSGSAGSLSLTNLTASGTMGVRALTTLTDGADGTNTSGYKFVSFVSNSAEAGNVIRVGTTAAVVFTTTSDEREKNVIGDSDLSAATERIMQYRMKDYEWKTEPGTTYSGPIAQQVYSVNKSAMLVPGAERDSWGVNMSGFVPDLIMVSQRQQAEIKRLNDKIEGMARQCLNKKPAW